jgi:hypothetical protein
MTIKNWHYKFAFLIMVAAQPIHAADINTQELLRQQERQNILRQQQEIKPYLHYWLKEGVTTEQRREDSVSCGGSRSDTHPHGVNDRKEKKLMLPGETVWETRERIVKAWKDCMESKGYHYVS